MDKQILPYKMRLLQYLQMLLFLLI